MNAPPTEPLRIAVNLLFIAPGRVGGSEEYLVRQLAGLPEADEHGSIEPVLYAQPSFAATHRGLTDRFEVVAMPFDRDWRGARVIAEHTWLAARSRAADVSHHGGGTVPVGAPRPSVLTVHDLQYLQFPQYFSAGRLRYLERMMPRSVEHAAVVAVPSEYVRGSVIEAFRADPGRVVVVPHGIPGHDRPTDDAIGAVRDTYRIGDRPYLVFPAITHPHKRHRVLIDMLAHLDPELRLVLLGGRGAADTAVERAIDAAAMRDRVIRPGRVPSHDRDAIVAGADALLFPSEYEGFGAPVVEAMALGTPVICGPHPALREVAGDAALVVDGDADAWAIAVLEARVRRDALVAAGHRRRQDFTIDVSGRALARAYRQAAGS